MQFVIMSLRDGDCLQNVDTESMSLILTGLARCGAWGCFDEFNRLQEATLSSISMLIQPIQSALKDKAESVQIGERKVREMTDEQDKFNLTGRMSCMVVITNKLK